jgi:hypothetical protein
MNSLLMRPARPLARVRTYGNAVDSQNLDRHFTFRLLPTPGERNESCFAANDLFEMIYLQIANQGLMRACVRERG